MWSKICKFFFSRVLGWHGDGGPIPEKRAVVLGVPHTSAWDFAVSYLFYTQMGLKCPHIMIAKEFFKPPLGWILKACRAIPVDRSSPVALVKSIIQTMESDKEDTFIIAIAPEGTRKAIKKWKTGYHFIARQVGCPVYMGYFDWGTKHIGCGEKIELTDNARADTDRIQAHYEQMHLIGRHPEGYVTH